MHIHKCVSAPREHGKSPCSVTIIMINIVLMHIHKCVNFKRIGCTTTGDDRSWSLPSTRFRRRIAARTPFRNRCRQCSKWRRSGRRNVRRTCHHRTRLQRTRTHTHTTRQNHVKIFAQYQVKSIKSPFIKHTQLLFTRNRW